MNKKEIKPSDIVGYLPYGLMISNNISKEFTHINGIHITHNKKINLFHSSGMIYSIDGVKIYLRPIEDIVNPCLPEGKIPIVEMLKPEINMDGKELKLVDNIIVCENTIVCYLDRLRLTPSQYDFLHEHQIDYRDLIGKGLAYNINEL